MKAGDVVIDRNARTAIVISVGRKLVHVVPMQEGELTLRSLDPDEVRDREVRVLNYPAKRAARKYLKHSGGVSKSAKAALKVFV